MPETQGPSFIPKRTPTKHKRRSGPRRLYIFSYIAYVLIFGAVLTAVGVFVYKLQLESQMIERQKTLAAEVDSFSQSDLEMVKEFEQRLQFASDRMAHHYALSKVFTLFERLTAATVQVDSLSVNRLEDEYVEVSGSITTDSFNSTIFQRDVMADDAVVDASFADGPTLTGQTTAGEESQQVIGGARDDVRVVEFTLLLQLDPDELQYDGEGTTPTLPTTPQARATSAPATTTSDNESGL